MLNHNFFFFWITQKTFLAKFLPHLQCNGHFSEGSIAGGLPEGTKTNVGHSLALRHCWWKKKQKNKKTLFSWCYHSLPSSLLYYLPLLLLLVIPRFTWFLPTWIGLRNSGTILNHNIGKGCNCTNVFSFIHSCHWIWKE